MTTEADQLGKRFLSDQMAFSMLSSDQQRLLEEGDALYQQLAHAYYQETGGLPEGETDTLFAELVENRFPGYTAAAITHDRLDQHILHAGNG